MVVWGFCLQDLNRKSSRKGEGKIGRTHMASGSWNSLKHVHLMGVCLNNKLEGSHGVAGRIGGFT